MSDEQKIWFIYLTDHHEGPFTAEEIAEKAKAGLVNGQSLAWKDGMPEWVAAETIPELAPGMAGGGAPAAEEPAAAAAPPADAGGEVSLAQLLAQSQRSGEATPATVSGAITDSASVLSSMVNTMHANTTLTKGSVSLAGVTPSSTPEPKNDDEVWTLKVGNHVSGLHSLRKLKELAGSGEVPSDAMLWHPGWSDFQPVSTVAQVNSARKSGGGISKMTTMGGSRPGVAMSAMSNAALDHDDEPTDTGLRAPPPGGIKGILFKVHTFFEKRKTKAANAGALKANKGKTAFVAAPKKASGGGAKRFLWIGLLLLVLAGAGGGGAYYFLILSSPVPDSMLVSADDRDQMAKVIEMKPSEGHKLYPARAKGTDENPADPSVPVYYVATNLPEGATVSMTVTGDPATMVNKISFEKTFTATVDKFHIATFDKINDDGKPLWGEFSMKLTADGADAIEMKKRFFGLKGGTYQKRLKTYHDSVQADYDNEINDLRQYITTLKSLQTEASKLIVDYKRDWATPALRTKITADWASFTKTSSVLLAQLEAPVKARQPGGATEAKFHGRAFQDVGTTIGQLQQLVKVHGERLAGASAPSGNADELDGLAQAGVQALETWLAQAVAKTPFDGSKAPDAAPKAPPAAPPAPAVAPPAAAPPAAAPVASPAPSAAPPAAGAH